MPQETSVTLMVLLHGQMDSKERAVVFLTFAAHLPLGRYVSNFQAEIVAILNCRLEVLSTNITGSPVFICADSQRPLKSLTNFKSSKAILEHISVPFDE